MSIRNVTRDEMIEVERIMTEEFKVDMLVMMENAGKSLAVMARELLGKDVLEKKIAVLVGKGNNGGGGLAACRHLHNWGANIDMIMAFKKHELKDAPRRQFDMLEKMDIPLIEEYQQTLEGYHLLIDTLIGYNSTQNPREPIATIIMNADASGVPILSLDVPSGLDATSGTPYTPAIRATTTLCLALPKSGIVTREAKPYVGSLYLADISIPKAIYSKFGVDARKLFSKTFIVRLNY